MSLITPKKAAMGLFKGLEQYRQLSLGGGGWSGRGHKDDVNVMGPHLVPRMLTQEAMPSRPRSNSEKFFLAEIIIL